MTELGNPAARAAFVVLAGGRGTRLGAGVNKVYLPLAGRPVLAWSLVRAARVPEVTRIVLVARPQDREVAQAVAAVVAREAPAGPGVEVIEGGDSRHASEEAAIVHLSPAVVAGEVDVVAVHDGARPLAGPELVRAVVRVAAAEGGAVPVLPAPGLLPDGDGIITPAGTDALLMRVQTPQAFRAPELVEAYARARVAGFTGTDTAATVEAFSSLAVHAVPGDPRNIKVTYPGDLEVGERLLAPAQPGAAPRAAPPPGPDRRRS